MAIKPIKTEQDYRAAMARIEALMDVAPGSADCDDMDVLAQLVEVYEKEHFPIDLPDPIAAIRFRMEQQGLSQQDLVPYIGSRSRASEVLSKKRPLSLSMIRALHSGLDIPAQVLLKETGATIPEPPATVECQKWPIREMFSRGWFASIPDAKSMIKDRAEELIRAFLAPLGGQVPTCSLNRQHVRAGSTMDVNALCAWRTRVLVVAQGQRRVAYRAGSITKDFMRQLVGLSCLDEGPKAAKELLAKNGIPLVIERHLTKTHLDGAAMLDPSGAPVIALTLRHDRLDNFWFTLCHELGHVALHLGRGDRQCFFDDLDFTEGGVEKDADEFGGESLIPRRVWENANARTSRRAADVVMLAAHLRISPAIIAGRIRRENCNYRVLSNLVGYGTVRRAMEQQEQKT